MSYVQTLNAPQPIDEISRALRARLQRAGVRPTQVEAVAITAESATRRARSLQSCHLPSLHERPRRAVPTDRGTFVPELSARLEDDLNLTDGARRCARKIAEITYRQNREGRALDVTVSYLARALGRCRRTVQRYLRNLESEGYIRVDVIAGERSRLCIGLVVHLLTPLLARHHREKWPGTLDNPGATALSRNQRFKSRFPRTTAPVSRDAWALRSMEGIFRAFRRERQALALA